MRLIDPAPEGKNKDLDDKMGKVLIDLAEYRNKLIENEEDLEDVADIFLELDTLLLEQQGKQIFDRHKGLELLMILYRKQKSLRPFVVKSCDFAMNKCTSL